MASHEHPDWDEAVQAFEYLFQNNDQNQKTWLLSIIDTDGSNKTDYLSALIEEHCQDKLYAVLSLELYVANIGGLLSAILDMLSKQIHVPENPLQSYRNEIATVFGDLSRKPLSIASNDIRADPGGTITGNTLNQSTNLKADADQLTKTMQHYSEIYSGMRIAESWLSTIDAIELTQERPWIALLFDDFDIYESQVGEGVRNLFLDILHSAHLRIPSLRVVIAGQGRLRLSKLWESTGEAKAWQFKPVRKKRI